MSDNQPAAEPTSFDAVVVGAAFAGMYMLYRLRGLGLSAVVFEAGADIGGTWYWNRYPGARCDVESMQYSYSFRDELQQDWKWSERYASQPEILRYINHVADRLALRRDIRLNTRVTAATFDEATARWTVRTDQGDCVDTQFCIMATGCLSAAKLPEIPGLADFRGNTYHTGKWPHESVDFTGQAVGVIGTGSSAIQSIPVIAAQAAQLHVFQRTPNFSIPARNAPLDAETEAAWKSDYAALRSRAKAMRSGILYPFNDQPALEASPEEHLKQYGARWEHGGLGFIAAFNDLIFSEQANDTAANFVRAKIGEIVRDPKIAAMLMPHDHPLGTKRICVDTDYYETFNRDNVTLVDIRKTPIEAITSAGIRTSDASYALGSIVFATGFDAISGALLAIDIRGRAGRTLRDEWADGPQAYLGVAAAGFPNLFMVTGPGSPSVLSNMIVSIEQHVEWLTRCIADLRAAGSTCIEATADAEDQWVAHVNEVADRTLYPTANSWYVGANVPGKPRVFMPYIGGVPVYREHCDEIAAEGYPGFLRSSPGRVRIAAE
jgi:cyclohexanone monooxygenase